MDKIGIITFHNAYNYGAVLQTYALQRKLSETNDVEIINIDNKDITEQYKIFNFRGKTISKKVKNIISDIIFFKKNIDRINSFEKFINTELKLTRKYSCSKNFWNNINKDCIIVGSDQVWNPDIVFNNIDIYTLNFSNSNMKKISYAASFGVNKLDDCFKETYKKNLKNFDYISVREQSGKDIINNIIDNDCEVVLDPTLLLKREEWEEKTKNCECLKDKYILGYLVNEDPEYRKIIEAISRDTGLPIVYFERKNKYSVKALNKYTVDPFAFINFIKNAEYVVCTSFHAVVFSIIFNKRFYVVPHKKTGSRVINLLNLLGISDRAIYNFEQFKLIDYKSEINYENVNKKLDEERLKSQKWLENAINS